MFFVIFYFNVILTRSCSDSCIINIKSCYIYMNVYILQAQVMKSYPSKLLFTALQCLLSSIQSFAIAIVLERRPSEWQLGWNVRLLAVAYGVMILVSLAFLQISDYIYTHTHTHVYNILRYPRDY